MEKFTTRKEINSALKRGRKRLVFRKKNTKRKMERK
jgi:hypothetical protein